MNKNNDMTRMTTVTTKRIFIGIKSYSNEKIEGLGLVTELVKLGYREQKQNKVNKIERIKHFT